MESKDIQKIILISISLVIFTCAVGLIFNIFYMDYPVTEKKDEKPVATVIKKEIKVQVAPAKTASKKIQNKAASNKIEKKIEKPKVTAPSTVTLTVVEYPVTEERKTYVPGGFGLHDFVKEVTEDSTGEKKPEAVYRVRNDIKIIYISLKEAKEYFDEGKAKFIDARAEYQYIDGHIKGAIRLSASRFNYFYQREGKYLIGLDDELIVYCGNLTCHLSGVVAQNLRDFGHKKIKVFEGGWEEWSKAGYPVAGDKVKGSEPEKK